MIARRSAFAALVGASLFVASVAHAGSVSITSDKDNTLYEDSLGLASNGAGQHFFAGKTFEPNNFLRRGLLHFDVAGSIPPGSRIDGVTLTVHLSRRRFGSGTTIFALHRASQDWGEGTSDASGQEGTGTTSTTGDATWINTFFATSLWNTAGGDFAPVASGSTTVGDVGFYTVPSAAGLVADVQDWLDNPATNFGWVVRGEELTAATCKRFDTREDANPLNRPTLTIDFCPPASFTNYGTGLAGTNGVPGITLSAPPVLCSTVALQVDNSLGATTPAIVVVGLSRATIPTVYGSDLLVLPTSVIPLTLPGAGLDASFATLCGDQYCGLVIDLQVLEADPGAIHGVSFTPGLELVHGL
jgi:hypothetical protein